MMDEQRHPDQNIAETTDSLTKQLRAHRLLTYAEQGQTHNLRPYRASSIEFNLVDNVQKTEHKKSVNYDELTVDSNTTYFLEDVKADSIIGADDQPHNIDIISDGSTHTRSVAPVTGHLMLSGLTSSDDLRVEHHHLYEEEYYEDSNEATSIQAYRLSANSLVIGEFHKGRTKTDTLYADNHIRIGGKHITSRKTHSRGNTFIGQYTGSGRVIAHHTTAEGDIRTGNNARHVRAYNTSANGTISIGKTADQVRTKHTRSNDEIYIGITATDYVNARHTYAADSITIGETTQKTIAMITYSDSRVAIGLDADTVLAYDTRGDHAYVGNEDTNTTTRQPPKADNPIYTAEDLASKRFWEMQAIFNAC